MSHTGIAVSAKKITKVYRRGQFGIRTMREDLAEWIHGRETESSDKFNALDDVSFNLARGRIYGVLGKNGSGKSTLMKVLASITEPTRGEVAIAGRVGCLLEVAAGFDDELSGYENIFLSGAVLGMRRREIQSRLNDIIEFSGVRHLLETPVKRYSSGSYVRLGFAVVAHLDVDILLLDEFMTVADAPFRAQAVNRLRTLAKEGRTVLMVSHELDLLKQLCTHGLLLDHGRLSAEGSFEHVSEIYSRSFQQTAVHSGTARIGQLFVRFDGSDSSNRHCIAEAGHVQMQFTYEGSGTAILVECLVSNETGVIVGSAISDAAGDGKYSIANALTGTIQLDFSQLRDGEYVVNTRLKAEDTGRILAQQAITLIIGEGASTRQEIAAVGFPATFMLTEY